MLSESYKKRIQELAGIHQGGSLAVYRCVDGEYNADFDGVEFFAINKGYAEPFGDRCYTFMINTEDAKILDLEKWNKLYTDKTGKNGNLYNRHQGLFVIGSMAIESGYKKELEVFAQSFGEDLAREFTNELINCDAIYGEDAGAKGELVFAVKNKSIISKA